MNEKQILKKLNEIKSSLSESGREQINEMQYAQHQEKIIKKLTNQIMRKFNTQLKRNPIELVNLDGEKVLVTGLMLGDE